MFDIVIKIPQVHFKNSLPLKKTSNNIVTLLASCICRIFHCLCGFQTRLISVGGNQFLGGAADSARYQCFFHLSSEVCSVPVGQAGAGTWWSFAAQSPRAWRFAGSSRELEKRRRPKLQLHMMYAVCHGIYSIKALSTKNQACNSIYHYPTSHSWNYLLQEVLQHEASNIYICD